MKKIFIIFIISFFLTGCLGYKELDNLMIINNIYIGKSKSEFRFILNEVSASNSDNGITKKYSKSIINCNSVNNCFKKFNRFPKEIYLSHLKNIIIDYSLSKKDIESLIKKLDTFKELREDFFIVFINDNNSKIISSSSLQTFLNQNKNSITFYELKKAYINKNKISIPIVYNDSENFKIKKYKNINWR